MIKVRLDRQGQVTTYGVLKLVVSMPVRWYVRIITQSTRFISSIH